MDVNDYKSASNVCPCDKKTHELSQWVNGINILNDKFKKFSTCNSNQESMLSMHISNGELDMLTIEGLKSFYNSCFTCGVSWYDNHISLDCPECGGYALERPCLRCGGQCDSNWKRNFTSSHEKGKAIWEGKCLLAHKYDENFIFL